MRSAIRSALSGGLILVGLAFKLTALDPRRALTQYTRTVWTQAQGLPQDTVRAIAQTPDGYLWIGTNEGLARFDGYEFLAFTRERDGIPANSVGKLLVSKDGALWIGTAAGLARYAGGRFEKFKGGVASGSVTGIVEDSSGAIWVVCGNNLYRRDHDKFNLIPPEQLASAAPLQTIYEDRHHTLWVGGAGGLLKQTGASFTQVLGARDLAGSFITSLLETGDGLWAGGTRGMTLIRPDGTHRVYTTADGLPNNFILAMREDRAGNLWVGTYGGLSRFESGRFVSSPRDNRDDRDWVWSLFEDREGDLWVGMNGGLNRLRDDRFRNYGRAEGFPSDDPYVVHQDKQGVIWVGYHDSGLVSIDGVTRKTYTTRDGLPSNEIFAIRDTHDGGLLVSTRAGLSSMHASALSSPTFSNDSFLDATGRTSVYDALEDARGDVWAATARGVYQHHNGRWTAVIPESAGASSYGVTLAEDRMGNIWAGTLNAGLWRIGPGNNAPATTRLYTLADGLGDNQIRSIYPDAGGTLWIGTFGSGLNILRQGTFSHYGMSSGLLSDNIAHVQDDGRGYLWLSTTRGITRVSKKEIADLAANRISTLNPDSFGVKDGLSSAQCAPASPASGGGTQTSDGLLWFTTMHDLATIDPSEAMPNPASRSTLSLHLLDASADGRSIDLSRFARLAPGTRRLQIRYAGIFLSAPERLRYSYRLEGFEKDWNPAGFHREVSYSPLPHGQYRFLVRASVPGGGSSEASFPFEVVPHFYETPLFICCWIVVAAAGAWGAYRIHLRRVHDRLTLVYEERARMAREIHDTLAQGFVGISAQLDALAMKMGGDLKQALQHLNLARKMAQHSITEARRSVMNLRAGELETSDLTSVLTAAAHRWVAGSAINIRVEIRDLEQRLPDEVEQHLLRIAQEAVTNAVKHSSAANVCLELCRQDRSVRLRVTDDGRGFEPPARFSVIGGHFGILGMRERAERLRAQFSLESSPGGGTQVEVTIPMSGKGKYRG